jgi:hypothetical protein
MYRVMVYEVYGKKYYTDFSDLEVAKTYADDCASETETGPVYADVIDHTSEIVYRGKHYGC